MKYSLLIATICLTIYSCKKTNNGDLSKPTGANILSCKVNGQAHTYKGKPGGGMTYNDGVEIRKRQYIDGSIGFVISADEVKYHDGMYFVIATDTSINSGLPLINKQYKITTSFYEHSYYSDKDKSKTYLVDTSNSTIFFTRFDEEVAAGTFEFHGFNENNKPVTITEGYFDISRK